MLSPNLEKTLTRALGYALERNHEYATLEHLLLALIYDPDSESVLTACKVNIEKLGGELVEFLDNQLDIFLFCHVHPFLRSL